MADLNFLQKTAIFKGCTQDELELISGLLQERQIKPNTTIFTEQMPAEALYIVKSGSIRISMMAGEGQESGLLLLGPGEFFGELALLQEENRLVTARAEVPAELVMLTRKDFHALLDLDPRLSSRIIMTIAKLLVMRVRAYAPKLKDLLLE
jgi:CRP/FNR family cyclic AMP-dependent transcriptional regulator